MPADPDHDHSPPAADERFVWPPAPPADPPGRSPPRPRRTPPPRRPAGGIVSVIESVWLGSAGSALGHRGNWTPEPTDAACPRCGRTVGPGEVSAEDGRCPGCRPEKLRWQRMIRLGEFDGELRRAVLETKYGRWRMQGTALGRLLGERLGVALAAESVEPSSAVLVPSPMPWLRRMRRGLDHAMAITRGVRDTTGCEIAPLLRRRHGPTQANVAASARASNIRSQIAIRRRPPSDASVLVLIDDVRTTGATLDACCRALEPHLGEGARVWAAVASVAVEPDRRRSGGRGEG